MKPEHKYILVILILAIVLILLYNINNFKHMIYNKNKNQENFSITTYPSIACKKIKLSSIDNNIYLFGILFYDDNGKIIDPNTSGITFDSSSVYNKSSTTGYYPYLAAKGIYNFIKSKNISRNILSLQNTLINYNTSDNAININFIDSIERNINLPASFGTWNINSKSSWISATSDTYTNGFGNSYWSITFPTQINLSAIELIGTTSVNTTMKIEITDNNQKNTFTQILPKTAPRDYYRQIVMPCQFYINIPDSNGNITNNYVNYSTNGYLTSESIKPYSTPDSFFIMQDTGKRFTHNPNRKIVYSSDGQYKFIYKFNSFIKSQKQSNTSTYDEDHIQIKIDEFTNNTINTKLSYVFGDYSNDGLLKLLNNNFVGSTNGTTIKLVPLIEFYQTTTTAPSLINSISNNPISKSNSTTLPIIESTNSTTLPIIEPTNSTTLPTIKTTNVSSPITTTFITTPYNTQYLTNIKNQINNGYSMLNNNRFAIMDNQIRIDSLTLRANKLLNNINKLSISN